MDWYAQDRKGNVWYLGEDTREHRDGKVVSTAGAWEAGRDSACGGIVMPAILEVGMEYRQAYRRGAVEDLAEVLSLDAKAVVLDDTFTALRRDRGMVRRSSAGCGRRTSTRPAWAWCCGGRSPAGTSA